MAGDTHDGRKSERMCGACGLTMSSDEDICPRCGNVYRKDKASWDWNLIPGARRERVDAKKKRSTDDGQD